MPYLTRSQVREIDRRAMERYGVPGIVLMENAARAGAEVAMEMLAGKAPRALIVCGGGNNGGDGLAMARHLHNRGVGVRIVLATDPAKYQGDALINWQIVTKMGLPAAPPYEAELARFAPSLIVDAIFGTGLSAAPREPFPRMAQALNDSRIPILAVDLPSGLDCDTGIPPGACIRATRTITFVALKAGFANPASVEYTGPVSVGDIGCPRELVDEVLGER